MPGGVRITVETDAAAARGDAEALRRALGAPAAEAPLTLAFRDDAVELRRPGVPPGKGFRVDFSGLDARPGSRNLSRRQPLPRAFGRRVRTIVDATAGFGQDGLLLSLMGFDVTLVERSPVIAALLEDGLRRGRADPRLGPSLGGRPRVVADDARTWLEALDAPPDAVYLDPMFPEKRKASALPPLAAQLLRAVVGPSQGDEALLEVARRVARDRVVVKRPRRAPPLGPDRSHAVEGKLVRYDVYVRGR